MAAEMKATEAKDQKSYALSTVTPKHDDIEEGQSKKLRRRIDLILLPLLCGTAVFDLFDNVNITSDQYSWLTSLFYFGYLFWEYPASYIAQRLPVGTVISTFVLCWGSILMITASSHNFTGLGVCRFLLGCFEAPITPCFMMIVGMWYLRQEQPFRAGCFYCCNGVGAMVGGLITYGIGQIDSFPVWKAVFMICGGATVRFTVEEKILLIGRGKQNQTGILNRSIKWYQIREAFVDPQVWILFLFTLLNETINGGFANFGKLIIKGLVDSSLLTTALGIPQGAFQVFFILSGSYLSTRFKNIRTIIMAIYLIPTVLGISLLWKFPRSENQYGVLFGYYITGSFVSSLVLALQMPSSNMGGYTKRVTSTALVFLAYCIGNIIGPHAFLSDEAPVYPTACKLGLACAVTQIACALGLRVLLVWRNRVKEEVLADLTDLEASFADVVVLWLMVSLTTA
ncbi:hypothetical protein SI65_01981 [Aspergillus cristatus]|uniref:Major facilitator superfamily (MFS) profile domain-containing protein n=1 Tax=Aspergillus cristatus TaxID=573508 RepID=A0A1E3BUE0_ASPCR|nr:hypothetical protein SI65_01981 [Aspergillus cristatus]